MAEQPKGFFDVVNNFNPTREVVPLALQKWHLDLAEDQFQTQKRTADLQLGQAVMEVARRKAFADELAKNPNMSTKDVLSLAARTQAVSPGEMLKGLMEGEKLGAQLNKPVAVRPGGALVNPATREEIYKAPGAPSNSSDYSKIDPLKYTKESLKAFEDSKVGGKPGNRSLLLEKTDTEKQQRTEYLKQRIELTKKQVEDKVTDEKERAAFNEKYNKYLEEHDNNFPPPEVVSSWVLEMKSVDAKTKRDVVKDLHTAQSKAEESEQITALREAQTNVLNNKLNEAIKSEEDGEKLEGLVKGEEAAVGRGLTPLERLKVAVGSGTLKPEKEAELALSILKAEQEERKLKALERDREEKLATSEAGLTAESMEKDKDGKPTEKATKAREVLAEIYKHKPGEWTIKGVTEKDRWPVWVDKRGNTKVVRPGQTLEIAENYDAKKFGKLVGIDIPAGQVYQRELEDKEGFKSWGKEAKEKAFWDDILSGKPPGFAWTGKASREAYLKEFNQWKVDNRISPTQIKAMQADLKAEDRSLTNQRKIYDMNNAFAMTIDKQIAAVKEIYQKLPRTNLKIFNIPIKDVRKYVTGSGEEAVAKSYLIDLSNEAGKISTGSTASIRELSPDAQNKWAAIHDETLSFKDIEKVLNATHDQAYMRLDSMQSGMQATRKGILEINPSGMSFPGRTVKGSEGEPSITSQKPADFIYDPTTGMLRSK